MRNRFVMLTAALVLACPCLALAQTAATPPQQPGTHEGAGLTTGTLDFGTQFSSVSGDKARRERYRDLRNGPNVNLSFNREGETYIFESGGRNFGYHDANYFAKFQNSRVKFTFGYDRLPLNYSYDTRTPYVEAQPNVFTLDVNARSNVQSKTLPGGLIGIPTSVATAAIPSIYRTLATPFNLTAQRDTVFAALAVQATERVAAGVSVTSYKRTGHMPWGAAFAFNNAEELPITVDNRTTDVSAGLEWSGAKGMFRLGYDGSYFGNNTEFLLWDNPLFASDYNCTKVTPVPVTCVAPVLWDPSGYSNGNGPARGRMSLAPSNQVNTVNATALYKLPSRTTLSGTFYVTSMTQNAPLAPWTTNANIANPATYAVFPALAHVERETAEASVLYTNAAFNLTSRPTKYVNVFVKYRFNNRNDRTPIFDAVENVRFDAVPEEAGGETEHLSIKRNTFDGAVSFTPIPFTAIRLGYGYDRFDRTGRSFSDMADSSFRVSVDSVGNQFVSVRALYEHTNREGSGFSESAIEDAAAQGGLRFYDEADRTRNRATLLFTVTPVSMVDLTLSWAKGKDEYSGPGHEFGLLNNDNTVYTVGLNVAPVPQVAFGVNYGQDRYKSNQKSRNANPAPDPQWTDPNRDWFLDADEKVNNLDVYLDLIKAIQKTDLRLAYSLSDSDNAFIHSGLRINGGVDATGKPNSLTAVGQFIPLPNVTNKWQRLTADLRYHLTENVVLGAAWWYEKFDVSDWATIDLPGEPGTPRIDYLGGLTTGYGNRPYKGNSGFLRVVYLF
jgi:hypothetical protein